MSVVAIDRRSALSADVAEAEFVRFVEGMGLDLDVSAMDEEDKKQFEDQKYKITRALIAGRLVIDDSGLATFTPQTGGDPITFYEPTGKTLIAMDQRKKDHNAEKLIAAIAEFTRQPVTRFGAMPQRDLKVCIAITNLFFGSK